MVQAERFNMVKSEARKRHVPDSVLMQHVSVCEKKAKNKYRNMTRLARAKEGLTLTGAAVAIVMLTT